jgi:hypothetical protein
VQEAEEERGRMRREEERVGERGEGWLSGLLRVSEISLLTVVSLVRLPLLASTSWLMRTGRRREGGEENGGSGGFAR